MANILTHIVNGLAWLWSLISLIFGTIATFLRIFLETIFTQLIFGLPGRIMLGSLVLIGVGFAITEIHNEAFEQFDEWFCETVDIRRIFAEIFDGLAQTIEIVICFYNLWASWLSTFVITMFEITLDCGDKAWLTVLEAFGLFLLRSTEGALTFLTDPVNNTLPIFSPQSNSSWGDESAAIPFIDPDLDDCWHPWVDLVDETRPLVACLCEDNFLNDVYNFLADRATSPYIGCGIDRLANAVLGAAQELFKTLTTLLASEIHVPDLKPPFTKLCQALILSLIHI